MQFPRRIRGLLSSINDLANNPTLALDRMKQTMTRLDVENGTKFLNGQIKYRTPDLTAEEVAQLRDVAS